MITKTDNGGFIIEGEESMYIYKLLLVHRYLKLEMNSGIRASRAVSALEGARNISGINFKTRKQALEWVEEAHNSIIQQAAN